MLRALAGRTIIVGAAQVAERGVTAVRLGQLAGCSLAQDLRAGSTLDVHAADQLPVFMALAAGPSVFRTSRMSSHASTAMWLLNRLTGARFSVQAAPDSAIVHVRP